MAVKETLARIKPDGFTDGKKGLQCSRYAYYLATGNLKVFSKAHPDYGPVNGSDMCAYLVSTGKWEYCKKENGAIFSIPVWTRYGIYYGHTGVVKDAAKNLVNDANWVKALTVGTHVIDLDAFKAVYARPKQKKATTSSTSSTAKTSTSFKKGDAVVPTNWVSYDGVKLAKTANKYYIGSIKGTRAVLYTNKKYTSIYAAVNTKNLKKVS